MSINVRSEVLSVSMNLLLVAGSALGSLFPIRIRVSGEGYEEIFISCELEGSNQFYASCSRSG